MEFSLKMNRLILICGPITSIMCAIWVGFLLDFLLEPFLLILGKKNPEDTGVLAKLDISAEQKELKPIAAKGQEGSSKAKKAVKPEKLGKNQRFTKRLKSVHEWGLEEWDEEYRPGGIAQLKRTAKIELVNMLPEDVWQGVGQVRRTWRQDKVVHCGRIILSLVLIFYL